MSSQNRQVLDAAPKSPAIHRPVTAYPSRGHPAVTPFLGATSPQTEVGAGRRPTTAMARPQNATVRPTTAMARPVAVRSPVAAWGPQGNEHKASTPEVLRSITASARPGTASSTRPSTAGSAGGQPSRAPSPIYTSRPGTPQNIRPQSGMVPAVGRAVSSAGSSRLSTTGSERQVDILPRCDVSMMDEYFSNPGQSDPDQNARQIVASLGLKFFF